MIAAVTLSLALIIGGAIGGAVVIWRREAARAVTAPAREIGGTTCFPYVKR